MRRVLHLGQVDIFARCREFVENLENCLKIVLRDRCTASSFKKERAGLEDGASD